MNRIKKEFRKKGLKLECDYPYLPFYIKGNSIFERGYIFVDEVRINSETATLYRFLNIGRETHTMQKDGTIKCNFD